MTIENLLVLGFITGLVVGGAMGRRKAGCIILLAVPIAMVAFIAWWQAAHPENIRSTSGLDYIFGPLWPSLGALGGYFTGAMFRSLLRKIR